jgi:hypothetical protein
MHGSRLTPGPIADHAFSLGLKAGALLGIVVIWGFYWAGQIDLLLAGYALIALFPVYLVLLATGLSVWLGYDKDISALRPVYRRE